MLKYFIIQSLLILVFLEYTAHGINNTTANNNKTNGTTLNEKLEIPQTATSVDATSCWPNMFSIVLINSYTSSDLRGNVIYFIELSSSTSAVNNQTVEDVGEKEDGEPNNNLLSRVTTVDSYRECLDYVYFRYTNTQTGRTFFEMDNELNGTEEDRVRFIEYEFKTRYEPYSNYSIELGYRQTGPPFAAATAEDRTSFVFDSQICYGRPGVVLNLGLSAQFENGSFLVEWDEPSVINAPSICLYNVYLKKVFFWWPLTYKYTMRERKLLLRSDEVPWNGVHVVVQAVNSHECYVSSYSGSFEACWLVGETFDSTQVAELFIKRQDNSGSNVKLDILFNSVLVLFGLVLKYV